MDASDAAVARGSTSVAPLRAWLSAGATVRSHAGLHAKVGVFEGLAMVGSANLSQRAHTYLTEAVVLTDVEPAVQQVSDFIDVLLQQALELTDDQLDRLEALSPLLPGRPVARRRGPALASFRPRRRGCTWLTRRTTSTGRWRSGRCGPRSGGCSAGQVLRRRATAWTA